MTLLTSQLLSLPSIWQRLHSPSTTHRFLGLFSNAYVRVAQVEPNSYNRSGQVPPRRLSPEDWVLAVTKGADEKSPRWRHTCLFAGLLIGMGRQRGSHVPIFLAHKVEAAVVTSANASLTTSETQSEDAGNGIALTLGHVYDFMSEPQKRSINFDLLLPVLVHVVFSSKTCLHSGYFLSMIDADVFQKDAQKFEWSSGSTTFARVQQLSKSPIFSILGTLSRLMALGIENVSRPDILATIMTDLCSYSRSLCVQWRQNKLSEVDASEEEMYLGEETLGETLPVLWRILRSSMFTIVLMLRTILGRVLVDGRISTDLGKPSQVMIVVMVEVRLRSNSCFLRNSSASHTQRIVFHIFTNKCI